MNALEANGFADRAAENAYVKLMARVMMMVTAPVVGFLAWQVFMDVGTLKSEVARQGIDIARLDTRLGYAEGLVSDHTASIAGTDDSGRRFQTDVVGRLAGVEVEVRGLRTDINRLFDSKADRGHPAVRFE